MYKLSSLLRDAGGSNPRLALAAVRMLQREVEWLLVRAVRLARQDGYDWGRIGRLLGVTRQSARERFQRLESQVGGPFPPHLRAHTDTEVHRREIAESMADARRRRAFEGDDPVLW